MQQSILQQSTKRTQQGIADEVSAAARQQGPWPCPALM